MTELPIRQIIRTTADGSVRVILDLGDGRMAGHNLQKVEGEPSTAVLDDAGKIVELH